MPDSIGGEQPSSPSFLSSPVLRKHGHAVARHSFRRCYETWPELKARHGERGRRHTRQDNYWHLEYLDTAAALGEPMIFSDYADWLVGLLEVRGVGREQVAGAFGFLAEAIEALECPPPQEAHRRDMVAILRDNQSRILGADPPADPVGPG